MSRLQFALTISGILAISLCGCGVTSESGGASGAVVGPITFDKSTAEESLPSFRLGKAYMTHQEWTAEPIRGIGVLLWRDAARASDDSHVHVCWIELSENDAGLRVYAYTGQDVGHALLALQDTLGISTSTLIEDREPLIVAIENVANSEAFEGQWIEIGTIENPAKSFLDDNNLIGRFLGLRKPLEQDNPSASFVSDDLADSTFVQDFLQYDDHSKAVTLQRTVCVRNSPWTCTLGPISFDGRHPLIFGGGAGNCVYSQTQTCTATASCGTFWFGVAVPLSFSQGRSVTWTDIQFGVINSVNGPCPPAPPAGTVPPPRNPPV